MPRIVQDVALTVEIEVPDDPRFWADATLLTVRSCLDHGFGGDWLHHSLGFGEFSVLDDA